MELDNELLLAAFLLDEELEIVYGGRDAETQEVEDEGADYHGGGYCFD